LSAYTFVGGSGALPTTTAAAAHDGPCARNPPVEGSGTGNEEAEQERLIRKRVSALEIRENNTSNFRQRQGFFNPFLRRYQLPILDAATRCAQFPLGRSRASTRPGNVLLLSEGGDRLRPRSLTRGKVYTELQRKLCRFSRRARIPGDIISRMSHLQRKFIDTYARTGDVRLPHGLPGGAAASRGSA
jgi:hypothetical protein